MEWSNVRLCDVLELFVILFQVFGVAGLCLSRLLPGSRWARHGRIGLLVAVIGLAFAGAVCGRHESEFALFAGGTMTVLLVGMIVGGAPVDISGPPLGHIAAESYRAG
jgi:hypothetical protein